MNEWMWTTLVLGSWWTRLTEMLSLQMLVFPGAGEEMLHDTGLKWTPANHTSIISLGKFLLAALTLLMATWWRSRGVTGVSGLCSENHSGDTSSQVHLTVLQFFSHLSAVPWFTLRSLYQSEEHLQVRRVFPGKPSNQFWAEFIEQTEVVCF